MQNRIGQILNNNLHCEYEPYASDIKAGVFQAQKELVSLFKSVVCENCNNFEEHQNGKKGFCHFYRYHMSTRLAKVHGCKDINFRERKS